MHAAVVVVGDEILSGHVRDANGHYIAGRLAEHGHRLRAIEVVSDDPADIAGAVARAVESADVVFVCGGVGPTHDDRTMEGVAAALGRSLVRSDSIAERVEQIADNLTRAGFEGDPLGIDGLRKMSLVPDGGEVLPCSIGLIPAVALAAGDTTVVVLPGPPRELQAVFRDAVEPRFLAGRGEQIHREELTHPFPESAVAAALTRLCAEFPAVSVGSYPMQGYSLVRITGAKEAVADAAERLRAELHALEESPEGKRLLSFLASRQAKD